MPDPAFPRVLSPPTVLQEEKVLPRVPLEACIQQWAAAEDVEYHSASVGAKTRASKTSRFSSFPPWLFVQLRRRGSSWLAPQLVHSGRCRDVPCIQHVRVEEGSVAGGVPASASKTSQSSSFATLAVRAAAQVQP